MKTRDKIIATKRLTIRIKKNKPNTKKSSGKGHYQTSLGGKA